MTGDGLSATRIESGRGSVFIGRPDLDAERAARERAEAHAAITSRVLYDGLDEVAGWRRELDRVVEALEERRDSASKAAREHGLEVERLEELRHRLQALLGAV